MLTLTAAAAAPALASTTTPAHGTASSGLRLLSVSIGGHTITAGELAAVASNAATPHTAQIVVTPATLDGTAYGQQKVTPANTPLTVPSTAQTATLPGGLGSVTGPTIKVAASDGAVVETSALLKALGSLTVGPLPVSLDANTASLSDTAKVTSALASGEKSVVIGGLALPSVANLLDALHIDPEALFTSLTQANLNKINTLIHGASLASLNGAVDALQAQVGANAPQSETAAWTAWDAADAAATNADNAATAANSAFTAAMNTLAAAVSPLPLPDSLTTALTPAQYQALGNPAKTDIDALAALHSINLGTLAQTAVDAAAAATTADNLATTLSNLIDALDSLAYQTFLNVGANTDPLASLGSVTVTTSAVASANAPDPVASASVGTLNVLGAITPPAQLTTVLGGVLGQLASVLNSVAGVSFTPPSVAVGTGTTSKSVTGTTHKAAATITAVTVTLPKLTLPTAWLPNRTQFSKLSKANFAAHARALGKAAGMSAHATLPTTVITDGGTLSIGSLSEIASYTPGTTTGSAGSPGAGSGGGKSPGLAGTGASYAIPVVAVLLVLAGLVVVRRRRMAVDAL